MIKKYRFQDDYESVYEYEDDKKAYIYIGSYYKFGITKSMSYASAVKKVKKYLNSAVSD